MRSFQRAVAGVAVLVSFLLALGVIAPYLVDGQTVRNQLVAKLSAWADGELRVQGDVHLTSLFDLTIEAGDVEIRNPKRFPAIERIGADLVQARLSLWELLSGRVVFGKVWVTKPVIALRPASTDEQDGPLWRAVLLNEPAVLERLVDAVVRAPFVEIELNNGTIEPTERIGGALAGLDGFTLLLERQSDRGFVLAEGDITWAGRPLRVSLERGQLRPEGPTLEAPVRFEAAGPAFGRVRATGSIVQANGPHFTGQLDVRNAPFSRLEDWLDLPSGIAFKNARYSVTGALEATSDTVSLRQLQVDMGNTRLTGLLTAETDGERPKVSGTMGLSEVDLRGMSLHAPRVLAADDPLSIRRGQQSPWSRRLGEWLQSFDADLRVSAESLLFDGVETGEAAAFLSVEDGRATLDVAELVLYDGFINGQFAAQWRNDMLQLHGKGKAAGVNIAGLLTSVGKPQLVSGQTDISFSVEGAAPTLHALARSLHVRGQVVALQGGELALDIAELAARLDAQELYTDGQPTALEVSPGRGDYDMLRASFGLRGNMLSLDAIAIAQDGWILQGQGEMDLAQLWIDWQISAARAAAAGPVVSNLSGIAPAHEEAIRLRLKGPLHHPRLMREPVAPPIRDNIHGKRAGWP